MSIRITEDLIGVREAARECGRNMETVRRWIWSGKLPAEKLGNQLFIKRNDLNSFCKAGYVKERGVAYRADLLERAARLRNRIRARTGTKFDTAAIVEELRKERENELEQSLR